jgi:hypothetical protein
MPKFIVVQAGKANEPSYKMLLNTAHIVNIEFKYVNSARIQTTHNWYFVTKEEGERIVALLTAE